MHIHACYIYCTFCDLDYCLVLAKFYSVSCRDIRTLFRGPALFVPHEQLSFVELAALEHHLLTSLLPGSGILL